MKYEFNFGNGVLCLPESVLTHMEGASELDLKLLLLLSSSAELRRNPDSSKLAASLGVSAQEIEISIAFWRGSGILKGSRAPKTTTTKETANEPKQMQLPSIPTGTAPTASDMPTYTGSEIEKIIAEKKNLKALLDECQNTLGKVFSIHETNKILALSDYLGLEDAYILLLCTYCKSIDRGSVAYVAKTATELYHNNVDTLAALEAYIASREKALSFEGKLRALMGIGSRALSTKEKKLFAEWAAFDLPDDVLRLAYDQTVDSSGKAAVSLMNTILKSWHEKGVRSVEDAQNCIDLRKNELKKQYAKKNEPATSFEDSSFNTDEFFDIALQKSMELAKEKQDGDKK